MILKTERSLFKTKKTQTNRILAVIFSWDKSLPSAETAESQV